MTLVTAANGALALQEVASASENQQQFSAIILDMHMPILDGYQTARKLRELGFETPILALTAEALQGNREKCWEAGCDEYLTKPIDTVQLLNRVAQHAKGAEFAETNRWCTDQPRQSPNLTVRSQIPATGDGAEHFRILCVDDSEDTVAMEASLFQMEGHCVEIALDGKTAINVASTFLPDVVLLDLNLPDISGFEVVKALRDTPSLAKTTFIAVSGFSDEETRTQALQVGFHHHVVKPLAIQKITQLIDRTN